MTPDQALDMMVRLTDTPESSSSAFEPLAVNGAQLAYCEYGSGPITVVSAQQDFGFHGYLDLLSQPPTNYRVVAIRLRQLRKEDEGPGEDARPRWYARWADDVYAAIQALGLSRCVYTGVSHGAVIGWQLAVEHPATDEELDVLLGRVRVPVLMIAGLHDPWVRPDALLRTTRVVAGSKLVLFEDESHLIALESPSRVAEEIELFADRLPAEAPQAPSDTAPVGADNG